MSGVLTALGSILPSSGGGGGGGATLLYDGYTAGTSQWSESSGWPGQELFQVGTNTTVTKISAYLDNGGSSTADGSVLTCEIYTDSSNNLGSLVATSTTSLSHGSLTNSKVSYDFNFAGASLTASTNYHIVFKLSSFVNNHFNMYHTSGSDVIPGHLCLWNTSGVNQYPGTFGSFDVQIRVYGTTP